MAHSDHEMASKTGTEAIPPDLAAVVDIAVDDDASIPPVAGGMPDGGLRAWLQVVGCWLVFFNVWGVPFAYGVFQNYYELGLLRHESSSTISWVGTVSSYLLIVTGVVSGPLFDLGHYRIMLFGGAAVACFGIMMLSLSTQYYQIMLAQGISIGLGCGVLYIPGIALVSRSFTKHRAMALGTLLVAVHSVSLIPSTLPNLQLRERTGGIIYTITFNQLIDSIGFARTVRVMGYIMIGSYLLAFPLLLWGAGNTGDVGSGSARKLFDKAAFKDLPFWLYTFANFFLFCGYLVPFFFMPTYGQIKLGMSQSLALYSIVVAQGVSVVARLVVSYTAVRIGVMIPWLACGTISGILCLAWIGVESPASFFAWAALYGGFSGALIPLPPSIFPVVCPDPKVLGTRLGMAQAIGAIASLIGSPIAGALVRDHGQDYLGMQLFSGLVMLIGASLLLCLWFTLVRTRNCKKLI